MQVYTGLWADNDAWKLKQARQGGVLHRRAPSHLPVTQLQDLKELHLQ
jgi:hypothetical protein